MLAESAIALFVVSAVATASALILTWSVRQDLIGRGLDHAAEHAAALAAPAELHNCISPPVPEGCDAPQEWAAVQWPAEDYEVESKNLWLTADGCNGDAVPVPARRLAVTHLSTGQTALLVAAGPPVPSTWAWVSWALPSDEELPEAAAPGDGDEQPSGGSLSEHDGCAVYVGPVGETVLRRDGTDCAAVDLAAGRNDSTTVDLTGGC